MKAKWPKFGAYIMLYNAEKSRYPWRECIRSIHQLVDHIYILECNSDDDTYDRIVEEFSTTPNITLKRSESEWDMNDTLIVGKMKQEARKMVNEEYCIYLDADEIISCKDKKYLHDLVIENPDNEVFSLPYVTFFGSPYQVGNFKNCENYWRWKIFKNSPHIGHGAHGKARKFNENGQVYIDKSISDGCEIINLTTLEIMPSVIAAPPAYIEAGKTYSNVPQGSRERDFVAATFSHTINTFPIVCLHYGWVNFENKANNALQYWTKTKAYKEGVEHSRLFDGLDPETEDAYVDIAGSSYTQNKIDEWHELDTLPINIQEHPQIMHSYLQSQLKIKILNVCQDGGGEGGVAKWGRLLTGALDQYNVQTLSFIDHVQSVDPNVQEYNKAELFTKYIKRANLDRNALVMFADGFWGATYTGPAKVVSIVHGLWHHPLREKYGSDGLVEQRKVLWEYQLDYFKAAEALGHVLVSCSPLVHKLLKEDYGIESKLISNSIDLDFYDSVATPEVEKDKPLILHGITKNHKGLDILPDVENHSLIKDKFNVEIIDKIAEAHGCEKAATFKLADVAFLPSKWEASSYLLLECLANNVPIVALRSGILHCTDLKHIENIGIILDEYDADKFAEALVEVYENRAKYTAGREFLRDNEMTSNVWNQKMKRLIYEVT